MLTADEVRKQVNLRDIAMTYGIHVDRKGMCKCPFHNDKNASARISLYEKTGVWRFHCFACGEDHDAIGFVQHMDGTDFKTAFAKLGGNYEMSLEDRKRIDEANRKRRVRELQALKFQRVKKAISDEYDDLRDDFNNLKEECTGSDGVLIPSDDLVDAACDYYKVRMLYEEFCRKGEAYGWS